MLCVYGIVSATQSDVVMPGVHGGTTSMIRAGDLAAIVSEVDGELLARRRDVDAHLSVLEHALSVGDVLPFRFGNVVTDQQVMVDVLQQSAARFRRLLAKVGGRVQMTLKAVRDDDEVVRTVVSGDPGLRAYVASKRRSAVWADRVELGERIAVAVDHQSHADAGYIVDRLARLADAVSVESVTPPTVATLALLMRPDRLAELDGAVAELHDALGHRMSFDYAGPMPAYSFVS